ncbi:MAG: hypothetical protein R3F34_09095 [Planctomycetota bacterium]
MDCFWTEADGALANRRYEIDLAPGEDRDLGTVDYVVDGVIHVVPVLVVDGERDPTLLDGAMRDATVESFVDTTIPGERLATTGHARSVHFDRFEGTEIRGAVPGSYDFWTPDVVLPDGLARSYRYARASSGVWISFDGGEASVEIPVHLESTGTVALRLAIADTRRSVLTAPDVASIDRATGRVVRAESSLTWEERDDGSAVCEGTIALPPGEWTVVVVEESLGPQPPAGGDPARFPDWVGRADVAVVHGATSDLAIDLVDAAEVRLDPPAGVDPAKPGVARVAPAEFETYFALLRDFDADVGPRVHLRRLLPNTEYVFEPGGARFTTGASGTTIEVEAH